MWMNFALTLNHAMAWLKGRPVVGLILGAIGGPLAYFAGAKLGAASPARFRIGTCGDRRRLGHFRSPLCRIGGKDLQTQGRFCPMTLMNVVESGWVPDPVLRAGMRRLMHGRLVSEGRGGPEAQQHRFSQFLNQLRESPVALSSGLANEQHYEVPAEFFKIVLGGRLKYSCCYFPQGDETLDEAEVAMLRLTSDRADIQNGMRVLELGCGWGAVTLWMAERFPDSHVTAVSNSSTQRAHIIEECGRRGFSNVEVITADMNDFDTSGRFDRVVSVEMFEHMRNYRTLTDRIAQWLTPDGKLFVHIFCHRYLMYPFTTGDGTDWMARHFFTDGLMPALHTLSFFQDSLRLDELWQVSGKHYEKTSNAWLERLDGRSDDVLKVFEQTYGQDARVWLQRWRMFFMACAELFGFPGWRGMASRALSVF